MLIFTCSLGEDHREEGLAQNLSWVHLLLSQHRYPEQLFPSWGGQAGQAKHCPATNAHPHAANPLLGEQMTEHRDLMA